MIQFCVNLIIHNYSIFIPPVTYLSHPLITRNQNADDDDDNHSQANDEHYENHEADNER